MQKEYNHFTLVIDDTGFNSHEKKSKKLKSEKATYCCAVIPSELCPIIQDMFYNKNNGLCTTLQSMFGCNEFHFTEIYNRKNQFANIELKQTFNMIKMFCSLINNFNIDVLTATINDNTFANAKQLEDLIKNQLLAKMNLPNSEPMADKSTALILSIIYAHRYLIQTYKNPFIDQIICDEGLKNSGTKIDIKLSNMPKTSLNFEESKNNALLQIADFVAWSVTRIKNTYDGKTSLKDYEEDLLKILSSCAKHFVNLSVAEIDPKNLKSYDEIIDSFDN